MKRKKEKTLKSKMVFNKATAMKFCKTSYYVAASQNMKDYEFIQNEKKRLSTTDK